MKESGFGFWLTPTVAIATGGQISRGGKRKNELLFTGLVKMHARGMAQSGLLTMRESTGALHPEFVSWVMGFPPEWNACAPLQTL